MRSVAFGTAPNHMTADREPSSSSTASDSPGDDEVDETHETYPSGLTRSDDDDLVMLLSLRLNLAE
jgi:hypothetical protein